MPTIKASEARREWIERNPLRQWRHENDTTLIQAAAIFGCSVSTVQSWETGETIPSERHTPALIRVLGEDLPHRWNRWIDDEPDD